MDQMFCFQCEQTMGCTGCTGEGGVCGKPASVALLQDRLTGALMGLARTTGDSTPTDEARAVVVESLFATVTNVDFSEDAIQALIDRVHGACAETVVETGRDAVGDFDMFAIWDADEDIRSLKSLTLFGLRGMAAYAYHARNLGYTDDDVDRFFFTALAELATSSDAGELLALALDTGKVNLACMELLDRANTETYGDPTPATLDLVIEKGPFIIVSGHDLYDLEQILEQTEGKGINVYTHGEMLPAHGYPKLATYPHLKGNFGTAWQNQRTELDGVPAPIVFTTNCLMPPRESYSDRVFTTEAVSYDGLVHIGPDKDFSPVIEKALELGGYPEDTPFTGINGGSHVTTGFGRNTVLGAAGDVVAAVKSGDINHFFLVAGCDGAKTSREYYTEFVRDTPKDSLILTCACGKFRFNDLELGNIGSLPRLLDMGQCNDAYGAIQVALALADAFGCEVNELPLSIILSWYEQKAVCILLTLLYLGITDIHLGPSLPAFVSPGVLDTLVKTFGLTPIGTVADDMAHCLA